MATEDYDVEFGYSLSDMAKSHNQKAYSVAEYELRSLAEIEFCINTRKYFTQPLSCSEHQAYLENLQKRLSMIMLAEEREGLQNWQLRVLLDKVRNLAAQLGTISGQIPDITVYKEKSQGRERGTANMQPTVGTHPEPMM